MHAPIENERRGAGWITLAAILLVTLALFWKSLSGEPVYDDLLIIGRNPVIADLQDLPGIVARPYWDFLRPEDAAQIGYWRPLTSFALAIAHAAGQGAPEAYHALSLIAHLLATAAAYLLVRRLTRSAWVGAAAALLFGLHPLQVESVAWISAVNDPLCGLLALLSLERFLAWRDRGSNGVPWSAAVLFLAALLAKEPAVAVLVMLPVLDLGRRRLDGEAAGPWGGFTRPAQAYVPFLAILLLYYATRIVVFGSFWAGFDRTTTDFGVDAVRQALLRVELFGGALELLAAPLELSLFRPFRPSISVGDPALLRAAAWSVAWILALLWLFRRQRRVALASLLLVAAGLVPLLVRLESLGRWPLSDRFLYLPVLGFALLVALALRRVLPGRLSTLALLAIAAAYAARSFARLDVWQNEERLYRSSVEDAPRSVAVLWGFGRVLLERHAETGEQRYLAEAFEVYERAGDLLIEAKANPDTDLFVTARDYLQVNLGMGWCHLYRSVLDPFDIQIALGIWEELARAIESVRDQELEMATLGIQVPGSNIELEEVLTAIGVGHMQAGALDAAERSLREALEENPSFPQAHQNLGRVLARMGRWSEAGEQFEKALAQRPSHFEDKLLLAQALYEAGQTERAGEIARELLERRDDHPQPMVLLAMIQLTQNDPHGALRWLDRATSVAPRYGFAWFRKGDAHVQRRDYEQAILAYQQAMSLMPEDFELHYRFGALLTQLGRAADAIPALTRAYSVCTDRARLEQLRTGMLELPFETAQQLFELASIEHLRGRFAEAEVWIDRALEKDPEDGNSLFLKGRILRDAQRPEEALGWMRRGCAQLPRSFNASSELGSLLAALGHEEEAVRYLERASALGPPADWAPEVAEAARSAVEDQLAELRSGG